MNGILIEFERVTELGPTKAAKLLGVAYVTYAQYRSCHRPLQEYHARHIQALLLLPKSALKELIMGYVDGST